MGRRPALAGEMTGSFDPLAPRWLPVENAIGCCVLQSLAAVTGPRTRSFRTDAAARAGLRPFIVSTLPLGRRRCRVSYTAWRLQSAATCVTGDGARGFAAAVRVLDLLGTSTVGWNSGAGRAEVPLLRISVFQ